MNFYVSNLSAEVTDEHLREAFQKHGEVSTVTIPGERMKGGIAAGPNRGYGFVLMPDNDQARLAMKALDKQAFHGQALSVQVARPRWTHTYTY